MKRSGGPDPRFIHRVEPGEVRNGRHDPPVKALFVYNSNPAAVSPNHNEVVRGLRRPDLFTVVHDQFLTDTTAYADILLPATPFFEPHNLPTPSAPHHPHPSKHPTTPHGEPPSNLV